LIAALGSTLRWRTEGLEHFDAIVRSGHQPIMVFWHGRILTATYYFRRRGIVVITSENFDGEWIAGIIERFGYGTARGSTAGGPRNGLLQLTREGGAGRAETAPSTAGRDGGGTGRRLPRRRSARPRADRPARCGMVGAGDRQP